VVELWRSGNGVRRINEVTLYAEPDYYWDGRPSSGEHTTSIHNQPQRPTQPPTLSGMGNEYRPKCGDALRLGTPWGVKARRLIPFVDKRIWVVGKTV